MEIPDEFLVDADSFYVGIDRLQYLSCRSCSRFTLFLVYLPPNDGNQHVVFGLQKDQLLFCPGCVPRRQHLLQMYPQLGESVLCDSALLAALQGFEYSNPFYRKYARMARTLVTVETRLDGELPADSFCLALDARFELVRRLFGGVHAGELEVFGAAGDWDGAGGQGRGDQTVLQGKSADEVTGSGRGLPGGGGDSGRGGKNRWLTSDLVRRSETLNATLQPYIAVDKRFNLTVLSSKSPYSCGICLLTEKDVLRFGEFIEKQQKKDIFRCHYFCLLTGTYIVQNGRETSGVLGFLVNDIYSSFKRYRQNKCCYCGQLSAAVVCVEPGCERSFHYICGVKNNCLTQFSGPNPSYCHEHAPNDHPECHSENQTCWICCEEIGPYNPVASFCSVCPPEHETGKTEIGWYHRMCVQKFAFQAGYYFKCPNCFEMNEFTEYARMHGIFVPMRDASWEREKYAFKDIHLSKCSAEGCKVSGKKSKQLVGCKACGGATMHMTCAGVDDPSEYVCPDCMDATFIKLF
ncbi:LOW QUALITY PROTEIN: PHD finger protein 7-like [Culex quinquefasciatus]|uniref:LOW QUALITY PROTEIN: PHD finger protein 7-like n=1 Tax=Culex quinquefasciatus TaxID=7176 RepID=UPI0018E32A5B|nr:LOW QUALITY PROTEIN: PHD finger protein 7-like [Culex quinquefasciatus]